MVAGTCPLTLFNDAGAALHLLVRHVSGRWASQRAPGVLESDPAGEARLWASHGPALITAARTHAQTRTAPPRAPGRVQFTHVMLILACKTEGKHHGMLGEAVAVSPVPEMIKCLD